MNQDLFKLKPIARKKTPKLPEKPTEKNKKVLGRFPSWLHRKIPSGTQLWDTQSVLNNKRLHTVCEEAKCPNRLECFSKKTATFLLLGKECTRACGFCDIGYNPTPSLIDLDEPIRIAESVEMLQLNHVVFTMVARDDLKDGGASHLFSIVEKVREYHPSCTIELLTSDFQGNKEAWETVLSIKPDIFNYNIETVRKMSSRVRHRATYDRTLEFLQFSKKSQQAKWIKSGIMLGFGETKNEVEETIQDLYLSGCDIITIGQYLQPSRNKLRVKEFITPEQFKSYQEFGLSIGVKYMHCGPLVRSSYNADQVLREVRKK